MNTTTPVPTTSLSLPGILTMSAEDNETVASLNELCNSINKYYLWVIFCIGFPGNIASVITVLSMSKLSTATLYVAILAIADASALFLKLLFQQLYKYIYFDNIACKMTILTFIFPYYANWILVLVCFERFLAVCFPFQKGIYFTKRKAFIIALLLFIAVIVFFFHLFITYGNNKSRCDFLMPINETVWSWFNVFAYFLAPFVLLVIFSTLIIVGLRQYHKERKSILRESHQGKSNSGNLEQAISVMMAVAGVVFLICTLPACIYFLASFELDDQDALSIARWSLFHQISSAFADLNHAINFYLYFLSARKFRSQFYYLVTCHRASPRRKGDMTLINTTQYTLSNSAENICMANV